MDHIFKEISQNLQNEDLSELLKDIPPELNEVLLLEDESIKKFEKHIQTQKAKVDNALNQLIINFSLLCYNAKKKAFDSLDKQLQKFRSNHDYLRRKLILFYPKNFSESQIANKDAIVKEFEKANSYLEIEAVIKQIQLELEEVKFFKANSQSTNYLNLQLLAKMVQKQTENLPYFQNSLLDNVEAIKGAFAKEVLPLFDEVFSLNLDIKEVSITKVGRLETVLDLDTQAVNFLCNLVAVTHPSPKFKLLYRGSRDGFRAHNFHSRCDKKGPTVVLIQSNHGKIFGGFAGASWTSNSTYVNSRDSFLFSLTHPNIYLIKPSQENWALSCGPNSMPTFGRNPDLQIADGCNLDESRFNIGLTYQSNNHSDEKIAGGSKFKVQEIEVFAVEAGESIKKPLMNASLFQSDLMTKEQYNMLRTWINPFEMEALTFQLVYKATKHGFDSSDFHKHCDGKRNTIVIIKSAGQNGQVFGGYTTQPWDCSSQFASDSQAFLFSLTERKKYAIKQKDRAIFKYSEAGPVFGEGYDLYICSNGHILKQSTSRVGQSYESNNMKNQSLSGAKSFLITEIEVFIVQNEHDMGFLDY